MIIYTVTWDVNKVLTFISAIRTDDIMLLSTEAGQTFDVAIVLICLHICT